LIAQLGDTADGAKSLARPAVVSQGGQMDEDLLAAARAEFAAEVTYLNTASLGLPPRRSRVAMQAALYEWRAGRADPPSYDIPVNAARAAYAGLVGVDASDVAVGSQVSVFAGMVASSLPTGSEVLVAEGDFTSILFPFLVRTDLTVREVPLERLAEAVTRRTSLVAVSAVQSADGRVADLAALEATGARILLDVTQAIGWLPVDARRYAYTVCGAYKWLLSPRGTAFFTIQPGLRDEIVPTSAGWYAGAAPWSSIYGSPLRLAPDARRFDVSPAWHAWVGTAPSLDLLAEVGVALLQQHSVGLANAFRAEIGLPAGDSAIVSLAVGPGADQAMRDAKVVAATRAGRLRLSFHLCNDENDVAAALEVVSEHPAPQG
jgi:selenocysteine lyase/cysteine desulfurase